MELMRPLVIFYSGDVCEWVGEIKKVIDGKEYIRMFLLVPDLVKQRYGMKDDDFILVENFSQPLFVRDYPKDYVVWLSNLPGNSVVFVFCGMFGEEYIGNELVEKTKEIKRLKDRIAVLMEENESLTVQLKELSERIRNLVL